MKRLRVRVF
ncbi:uncharacterized protein FFNC_15702 [Fusarium fujikuroi]|nr:uncharacterized protein FFE2_16077 [Fusarium fujikuroi]SCO54968.1 uncharacterized protein FFNC_15702 [Fusarium fujikuroi]